MKKNLFLFLSILFLVSIAKTNAQVNVKDGLNQITPELLKKHIYVLADDSMKGRKSPGKEIDKAADYIANDFKTIGLLPVKNSYFQIIPFCTKKLGKNSVFVIHNNGKEKSFEFKTDYNAYEMSSPNEVNSQLVFVGYGITAPEYAYDDYKNIDVKGKIVVVLSHEPGENDDKSKFLGTDDTKYALLITKIQNAVQHGAIGLILVTDPLNHSNLSPQGYSWSLYSNISDNRYLSLDICKDHIIPVIHGGVEVIKTIFENAENLQKIQSRIDSELKPNSFEIKNITCKMRIDIQITEMPSKNVLGYIEGTDPELKNELVIVGGHYDHVGYKEKHSDSEDYILNGADDNASGTSGVMAIAKAFTSMKVKPKRSVLFMAFTAEEKGLLGSKYYCNIPLFPLNKTVAMLNLDMISRNHPDSIEIIGKTQSPDVVKINEEENKAIGLKLKYPSSWVFGGSDHASFYYKGIPVIFYFAGLHHDYHTVRDNPNTVDCEKAARISKLAFLTAWRIANEKKYYKINRNTF